MLSVDLPASARIFHMTKVGHEPASAEGVTYVLINQDEHYELIYRLGYLERQVDAMHALAAREVLTGRQVANGLDLEHV